MKTKMVAQVFGETPNTTRETRVLPFATVSLLFPSMNRVERRVLAGGTPALPG